MVVTSDALAAGQISVRGKPEWIKKIKSRFKNKESLIRTVYGGEFQTGGAENRKARLEKSVPVNGWTSSGMADERKVRLQTRSVIH